MNDPRVNGDFIRYSSTLSGANMNILLHSLPNNLASRQNLTVFASQDEGSSFPISKIIFPGLAQYSSLTVLSDRTIGMYYEMADPGSPFEMYFARFSLNLLGISGFSVLPINFISFEGQLLPSKEVQLDWKAETDNQFSHFEIERSTDQNNFKVIGQVAKENPFTFIDEHPATGINYYRLRAVDIDGSVKYSKIIRINNNSGTINMSLRPNPVSDNLVVSFTTSKQDNINIRVTDLSGRLMLQKTYEVNSGINEFSLNVKSWTPQIYIVNSRSSDNQLLSKMKFVKQ